MKVTAAPQHHGHICEHVQPHDRLHLGARDCHPSMQHPDHGREASRAAATRASSLLQSARCAFSCHSSSSSSSRTTAAWPPPAAATRVSLAPLAPCVLNSYAAMRLAIKPCSVAGAGQGLDGCRHIRSHIHNAVHGLRRSEEHTSELQSR